jgi:predicted N-acetyltransferase YhbS
MRVRSTTRPAARLRAATPDDIPVIAEIECRAFQHDSADDRRRAERSLQHAWPEYVLLDEDGQSVATAHVAWQWLRIGRCSLLKGDVGHVAVPPELQGRGHGTTLMAQLIPHMAASGCHVSRLGGLTKFYRRFGYEPFPRRYVHIPVPRLDGSLKGQPWSGMLALAPELARRVRPYHPARDHAAVHRLRYQFDATRSGQRVIAAEPSGTAAGDPDPAGLVWVYDDGSVRGFLRGALGLVHAGDAASSYRLDDLVYAAACPEAVEALVKTLMQRAQDRAPTTMSCRLPYDETLFAALTAANIAFEVVESHPAADGNMMRVLNLPETLRAVEAELSDRLQALPQLPWEGTVKLVLPEGAATLRIGPEGVRVAPDNGSDFSITASQAEFLKWLFGIAGFAEFPQSAALPPAQRLVLACLFPRLPCASGPWG